MKIQLVISKAHTSAQQAEQIWRQAAQRHQIEIEIVDIDEPTGRALSGRLSLITLPALLVDGRVRAIGVQDDSQAEELLRELID